MTVQTKSWGVYPCECWPPVVHVVPLHDLIPHYAQHDCDCQCDPTIETLPDGGRVVRHNAYDGRERTEPHD